MLVLLENCGWHSNIFNGAVASSYIEHEWINKQGIRVGWGNLTLINWSMWRNTRRIVRGLAWWWKHENVNSYGNQQMTTTKSGVGLRAGLQAITLQLPSPLHHLQAQGFLRPLGSHLTDRLILYYPSSIGQTARSSNPEGTLELHKNVHLEDSLQLDCDTLNPRTKHISGFRYRIAGYVYLRSKAYPVFKTQSPPFGRSKPTCNS